MVPIVVFAVVFGWQWFCNEYKVMVLGVVLFISMLYSVLVGLGKNWYVFRIF